MWMPRSPRSRRRGGRSAELARDDRLDAAELTLFRPLKSMLASPAADATEVLMRLGSPVWVEDKYDGIRAQLHRRDGETRLYSRDLHDVSGQFPEVVAAAPPPDLGRRFPPPLGPSTLGTAAGGAVLERHFAAARQRGNEGLMVKDPESGYSPGRRGYGWLKLKRPLATLDCVVVGVEVGHGKRHGVLSH